MQVHNWRRAAVAFRWQLHGARSSSLGAVDCAPVAVCAAGCSRLLELAQPTILWRLSLMLGHPDGIRRNAMMYACSRSRMYVMCRLYNVQPPNDKIEIEDHISISADQIRSSCNCYCYCYCYIDLHVMHAGPSLAPVGHVRWRRNRVVIRTGSGGGSGYAYAYTCNTCT